MKTPGPTKSRLKLATVIVAFAAIAAFQPLSSFRQIEAQTRDTIFTPDSAASLSPGLLIDNFDKTIQQRFLTAPFLGIARLAPVRPVGPRSAHMAAFHPNTPEEFSSLAAFEREGWDVGVYLFGRRVEPRTDTKKDNQYDIRYRLFNPIPVTKGLRLSNFRKSKKLASEVKHAFLEFQDPQSRNFNELRFSAGEWSYIARPVRAVNQSCLQCHKDYVITDKIAEGKFTARPRRIGDVNGVLFYAFRKRKAE